MTHTIALHIRILATRSPENIVCGTWCDGRAENRLCLENSDRTLKGILNGAGDATTEIGHVRCLLLAGIALWEVCSETEIELVIISASRRYNGMR